MAGLETIILYIISLPVRVNGRIGDHYIIHYFSLPVRVNGRIGDHYIIHYFSTCTC